MKNDRKKSSSERNKVIKTTFEGERKMKEEAWLNMTGGERLAYMTRLRKKMRKPGVKYSFVGMKVKVKRLQ